MGLPATLLNGDLVEVATMIRRQFHAAALELTDRKQLLLPFLLP